MGTRKSNALYLPDGLQGIFRIQPGLITILIEHAHQNAVTPLHGGKGLFKSGLAFTYSREEDTPAYDFEDVVDPQVAQDRYDILMKTQLNVSEAYNKTRVGKVYHVLCEGFDPVSEAYVGRSYAEAADIDGKIWFTSSHPVSEGEMVDVRITEYMDYDLVGETVL